MNITVVGAGYVGISNAVLLAQHNRVTVLDVDEDRISDLRARKSPVVDPQVSDYLENHSLNLLATTQPEKAYQAADYVLVATPTNYDPKLHRFDTETVRSVVQDAVHYAPQAVIVIKSTVPVGFTDSLRRELATDNVFFSPEFLREGRALQDNLYPSRIVLGEKSERARRFGRLLREGALKQDVAIVETGNTEAEAIKLFANTYLAMRVAFFNELDTYAEVSGLDSAEIIQGVCEDPRIGNFYNNPSFGYGGYCLPKDTKQMLANFSGIPNELIRAIVDSNETRKDFVVDSLIARAPRTVGIYRLLMKSGSDNFRESAVLGVIDRLHERGVDVIIYEPSVERVDGIPGLIENDFEVFKGSSDLIVANRVDDRLQDVRSKVYSRDIFHSDG
jgi:UDPglucose 6-dehydrogenase